MTEWDTEALIEADKRFVWHPFTNMPEWCAPGHEPLVLVEGNGATPARQPGPRIHRWQFVDLDEHSRPQSSAHQCGNPPAARPRGAHFFSWVYQPGRDRACTCDCRAFPEGLVEPGLFLRRRFDRSRGRLKDRRSVLAAAALEKTSVHRLQERLSRRYGGRGQPGRDRHVPVWTFTLEFSGHSGSISERAGAAFAEPRQPRLPRS